MNTKNKWISTIVSLSALGTAILLSAPAKANCGDQEHITANVFNQWAGGNDYCETSPPGTALLIYAAGYNDFSNGTGYAIGWMQQFIVSTGAHSFADGVCVSCNNDPTQVCSFPSPWETITGTLPGTYPPSEYAICPTGDYAYQATAYVQVN